MTKHEFYLVKSTSYSVLHFQEGREHKGFKKISDQLDKVIYAEECIDLEGGFDPACLLPGVIFNVHVCEMYIITMDHKLEIPIDFVKKKRHFALLRSSVKCSTG